MEYGLHRTENIFRSMNDLLHRLACTPKMGQCWSVEGLFLLGHLGLTLITAVILSRSITTVAYLTAARRGHWTRI